MSGVTIELVMFLLHAMGMLAYREVAFQHRTTAWSSQRALLPINGAIGKELDEE